MAEKRIKFNNIVQNQLPTYVREQYPLISEFLRQYYIAQEYQGAPIDLIQNIDQYTKLDRTTNLSYSAKLKLLTSILMILLSLLTLLSLILEQMTFQILMDSLKLGMK